MRRLDGWWRLAALMMLVLMIASGRAAAALPLAQDGPQPLPFSPARGHAQVVAQGVAALPVGEIAWRVAYHSAKPFTEAPSGGRDLGFLVVDQGSLLVSEEPVGGLARQTLLAPGEAAFVPGGAVQRRGALDGRPSSYYAIELAPAAAASEVGSGTAVYASPPFTGPREERDLNLVRDVVGPGESTTLSPSAFPTLILITLGTLRVEGSDGAVTTLKVGEAASFTGELALTGEGPADAAFVAAVVGRNLAEEPSVTPQRTGPGAITVLVHACPPGVVPGRDNLTACANEPKAVSLSLATLEGAGPRDVGAPIFNDGVPTWDGLSYGDYLLRATAFAPDYTRFFAPGLKGIGGPAAAGYPASPEAGYQIRLSETTLSMRLDVYVFVGEPDADETGSIGVHMFICPGISFETFDPAACSPLTEGFEITLSGGALTAPLGLADMTADAGGALIWDELPYGQYTFAQPLLAPGASYFYIPSAGATLLPDFSGYTVAIDANTPDLVLDVYNLTETTVEPTAAPTIDSDGDGLTDDAELTIHGTNATLFDTDGDGVGDGDEIAAGTDPFSGPIPDPTAPPPTVPPPAPAVDSDLDGLSDSDEAAAGTNATDPDTDNDGWLDGNEVSLGTNPLDPGSFPKS